MTEPKQAAIDEALINFAKRIAKLAMEMPAPNPYTPQFIMLAQSLESYARTPQPAMDLYKESIRYMSIVFDEIAALLDLPKEQYGDPDALMDAIEVLKGKAAIKSKSEVWQGAMDIALDAVYNPDGSAARSPAVAVVSALAAAGYLAQPEEVGEFDIIKVIDRCLMDHGKTVSYGPDAAIVEVDPFNAAVSVKNALKAAGFKIVKGS